MEDRLIVSEQNADAFTNRRTEVITLPPWKLALVEIIQIYLTTLPTLFKVFVTVSEVSEQFTRLNIVFVTVCTRDSTLYLLLFVQVANFILLFRVF